LRLIQGRVSLSHFIFQQFVILLQGFELSLLRRQRISKFLQRG
jgi:hypothetical protein